VSALDATAGAAEAERGGTPAREARLELRLWLRLLTCAGLIERRVRQRLRTEFDTTLPRFDLLAQLDRTPEGLSMGEISERLMVSNGNVTGLVTRLAREGLVRREATPRDRRSARVRLTPLGKRSFDAMTPAHAAWIAETMRGLDPADMQTLMRLLDRLKETAQTPPDHGIRP